MTTYTLTGIAVHYNAIFNGEDEVIGITPNIQLQIVVPDDVTSFSYSLLPPGPDTDEGSSEIDINAYSVRLIGSTFDTIENFETEDEYFLDVTSSISGAFTVLGLFLEDTDIVGNDETDFLFVLDGSIPSITTVAEWEAFENSLISVDAASSPFGPGQDILLTSLGATVTEDDLINGTDGDDDLDGGVGNDTINGGDGSDNINGGSGNDSINPGSNDDSGDFILASAGNDTINFGDASEFSYYGIDYSIFSGITATLDFGTGNGTVDKNGSTDTLLNLNDAPWGIDMYATDSDDILNITNDNDNFVQIVGGGGSDTFNLTLNGGTTRISHWNATQGIVADLGAGTIVDGNGNTDTVNITDNGGRLELRGTDFNDDMTGSSGDERFITEQGNDTVDGGGGWDTMRYDRGGVGAMNIDLEAGTATGTWDGFAFTDSLSNIDAVRGSRDGDDTISGTGADERFEGRGGNDSLDGLGGNDTLFGEDGNDTLLGGAGDDDLIGGEGNDTLIGGAGENFMEGGAGDDLFVVDANSDGEFIGTGLGNDTIDMGVAGYYVDIETYESSGPSIFTVNGVAGTGSINNGADGTVTLLGVAHILSDPELGMTLVGTGSDDVYNITQVSTGWMSLSGQGGDDTFNLLAGTGGTIRMDYRSANISGIVANLGTGIIANDGRGGSDTINGVENVTELRGSMLDDNITGSARGERFILMAGDDTLNAGNGFDTLRYDRNQVEAVSVDLVAGTSTGIWRGEAFTHTISGIEAVRGSLEGNDTMAGSFRNERLEGRGGNDSINGAGGNDTLYGGDGNDTAFGGVGNDSIEGDNGNDRLEGEAGFDTINGGGGQDTIVGGGGADSLFGDDGNDRIEGGAGFDQLYGGDGNDTLLSGETADRVYGGEGDDLIRGGTNLGITVDGLFGEGGDDTIFGDGGYDLLDGGIGNDYLDGGNQADNLYGRDGEDTLLGGEGLDRLFGGNDDDEAHGGGGNDGLFGEIGNDTLNGDAGNDRFFGGTGNDLIDGGADNDTISGGAGFDTITGGTGDDVMFGRFNADTFVFENGHGVDTIRDFNALNNFERIDLSGVSAISDLAALELGNASGGAATQVGLDVVIDTGGGNQITLSGVSLGDLDSADFIF